MGTKEAHHKKAQHNEDFFNHFDLKTTPFLDWVVTAIFYAALHHIRALASKNSFQNISSYGDMDKIFTMISVF